jgi:hypothetical protein
VRIRGRREPADASANRVRVDRQPRLVLRFAVVTALGLALAGALILVVVREIDQRHAVRAATDRAYFVAETFLRDVIRPADVAKPVRGSRRAQLDTLMRRHVLIDGALRVSVIGSRGQITYSTDHHLIGTDEADPATLADVRGGAILSRVSRVQVVDGHDTVKALVSSVPIAFRGGTVAVVSIEQDYAPIAADARESLLPVAGVLEVALVLLFVLLVPLSVAPLASFEATSPRSATKQATTRSPGWRIAKRSTTT